MKLPNGYVIYRGPSLLNQAPIVAVVIASSANAKTGDMAQTYILPDSGARPVEAIRSGADESVCGDCIHRPRNAGTCYVVVRQGATIVWQSLHEGRYADLSHCVDIASELIGGKMIRLGTYGDPAAVPVSVWRELLMSVAGWVGYTHQWQRAEAQPLRDICMASVDSAREMDLARAMGWRTFRVRTSDEPLQARESICPASAEAGHKLKCATCGACDGAHKSRQGSIAIVLHGNHPRQREERFTEARGVSA